VVVALGDQPLVPAAAVASLLAAWRRGAGPVVSAAYQGRHGHPKLFDRAVLGALQELSGDAGARGLLASHPDWVVPVEVGGLGSDLDVDDEAALARARALLAASGAARRAGSGPRDG
jgi:molybdenum cofactor cytidylyltransferase